MRYFKVLVLGIVFMLCGYSHAAQAAPQTGWYWNPNESGRGFFVESHDGVTFIGAYLYDTDGHATWLVSAGPNADSYNFTGDLYNKSNGQTLFGAYVPPGPANVVGTLSVHFSDDTHATLTWPGGTVAIERQIYGTGDPLFDLDNGWWWNPDEDGSGYSVEVQGSNLFLVGFMYGDDGRPVWYYSAGPMSSSTTYHGDVLQFANGQTMGGAYQPPTAPVKIATLDIEFTAQNEATITFTDASGTASVMQTKRGPRSKPLQPQIPKPGRFVFPKSYSASFDAESDFSGVGAGKLTITSASIPMKESFTAGPPGAYRLYVQDPQGFQGLLPDVTFAYSANIDDCTETGTLTVQLPLNNLQLQVTSFSKYTVTLNVSPAVIPTTITCPDPDGGPPTTVNVAFAWPGGVIYTHTARISSATPSGTYIKGFITDKWAQAYDAGGHASIFVSFVPSY